jgi:hypothetical protein
VKKAVKRRVGSKTERRTRRAPPSWPAWDGPDRVWWGGRFGSPVVRKGAPLPAVDIFARPSRGARHQVVQPGGGGLRIPLREHPAHRARWQALRAAIGRSRLTRPTGPHLDQAADLFLAVEVGRAAMLRARTHDPVSGGEEMVDTQEMLTKASARLRQVGHRLRAARRQAGLPERLAALEAQHTAALRARFIACGQHEAAVSRFNVTWTEGDCPSMRQLTNEKIPSLVALGRPLTGELGYTTRDAARLLAAVGYIQVSASAPSGEKSPAQGLLETALRRDHKAPSVRRR